MDDRKRVDRGTADAAVATSRRLSYVLRHRPDSIGVTLDPGGWVEVDALLAALARHGTAVDRGALEAIVRGSDKQRFALSADGLRIRAQQGHSIAVDLGHAEATPPALLYHGTVARFVASIQATGLVRGRRHHVHLSATRDAAEQVGRRRGDPVILEIRTAEMVAAGHRFWVTPNQVWLTDHVPPTYIHFPRTLPGSAGSPPGRRPR